MPIRPDLRKFYRGAEWQAARRSILERAKDCCEQCGKPNGERVETISGSYQLPVGIIPRNPGRDGRDIFMWWRTAGGYWTDETRTEWKHLEKYRHCLTRVLPRYVRVVLTVAHLNHKAGDDRPENLKALCQWCHLNYDRLHHHETRGTRKDSGRPLLTSGATTPTEAGRA